MMGEGGIKGYGLVATDGSWLRIKGSWFMATDG